MKEIKCPKCGTAITVNDADFAELISQIRNEEFNSELERRVAEMQQLEKEKEARKAAEEAARHKDEINIKEQEITTLKQRIESWEEKKSIEIQNLQLKAQQATSDAIAQKEEELRKKEAEINRLLASAVNERQAASEREKAMEDKFQAEKAGLEKEVELYKNFKAKRSVKLLGEDLEQHCYALYNQVLLPVMPNATFEKDNESVREEGEAAGTKGDFIFREKEDGVECVSIMFEMKNESDATTTKHRNSDFYAKLDSDRRKKGCEYAVLVSMLELDNEHFSGINVIPGYEKMYMVRPDQFIPIITLLVQSGKKSFEAKKELILAKSQSADVTHFEEQLEKFKDMFGKNVLNAKKKYDEAIKNIDKTIETMQAIKTALTVSAGHLDAAENKVEDLTIRKLTYKNPTMKEAFDEARRKRNEQILPEEQ